MRKADKRRGARAALFVETFAPQTDLRDAEARSAQDPIVHAYPLIFVSIIAWNRIYCKKKGKNVNSTVSRVRFFRVECENCKVDKQNSLGKTKEVVKSALVW